VKERGGTEREEGTREERELGGEVEKKNALGGRKRNRELYGKELGDGRIGPVITPLLHGGGERTGGGGGGKPSQRITIQH